ATSRQSMGVFGEIAWRVPSLAPADAVSLFHERAGSAGEPRLDESQLDKSRLDESRLGEPDLVAQICRRLDGIPLAIDRAAARPRAPSLAQTAARLDDRSRLPPGGSRTALPRHRTLKAAVDWGYQLLTAGEQALLRRLSVFAGGFSLEAAEAVA